MPCSLYIFNQQYTGSLNHKMCLNMVLYHYLFNNFPYWMFKSLKSYHYYKWCCEGHLYASTFAYISDSFLSIDSWRWNCSFKDDISKVLMRVSELVSRKIAGVSPVLYSITRKVTVKKKPFLVLVTSSLPPRRNQSRARKNLPVRHWSESGYLQCLAFARKALHSSSKTLSVKMSVFNILLRTSPSPLPSTVASWHTEPMKAGPEAT